MEKSQKTAKRKPRCSPEERDLAVRLVEIYGLSAREVAAKFEVTKRTINNWRRRARAS